MANADNIGPAHVNSGAVIATASAPYATASDQPGDSTHVVTASYVKGAYNDTIAAINKMENILSTNINNNKDSTDYEIQNLYDNKQDRLLVDGDSVSTEVISYGFGDYMGDVITGNNQQPIDSQALITAVGVESGIQTAFAVKGVSAVTTWKSDTPTLLRLTTASN